MISRVFYCLAFLLVLAKISGKLAESLFKFHWASFGDPVLTGPLVIVLLTTSILFFLAVRWSRILHIPAAFIFLILPFAFYFLLLTNNLCFQVNDCFVLWGTIFILMGSAWVLSRNLVKEKTEGAYFKSHFWEFVLIGIFLFHGFLLFIDINFRVDRVPFGDENSLWYTAAKAMLDNGFLPAHQQGYSGGGLHPLGIPFLSALPGLLFNDHSPLIPFFMPVFILTGLFLILYEFIVHQQSKWGLIFFLVAWVAAFNNKSWPGELCYARIYGESVSMVLILSLLSWFAKNQSALTCRAWVVAAFFIGLLALTKFPLILLAVPFFIVLMMQAWEKEKDGRTLLLMGALFIIPFLILRFFQIKYGGALGSVDGNWATMVQRLRSPNTDMLRRVVANIAVDDENLLHYSLLALVLSIFCYRQWRYTWPVLAWILFLFIHYAYLFAYGLPGKGDHGSGLRYFLPAAAGLLFCGAQGVSALTGLIEKQRHHWARAVFYFLCLGVIFSKLF